jgi:glutamate/tyrosine decarboxylase-like PLP-dependent enzyme
VGVRAAGDDPVRDLLARTAAHIADYREGLAEARVFPATSVDELRHALGGPLPERGTPAGEVVEMLATAVPPGLVASAGPRYFGFVTGGSLPAATAADLLVTGWDQLAFNPVSSPASAVVEEVAGGWLKEVLGLPAAASVGFVTGGQGANTVALAAARHHVLAQAGWDVEGDGLIGAPPVRVIAGAERHATIDRSLRLLGLGSALVEEVPARADGSIDPIALEAVLAGGPDGPLIVCLQAGNVNSGACDDLVGGVALAQARGAWVHVDGAFGLWAAASPRTRPLVDGLAGADSWACDGHKWLNVPYDSGYAFCAHPEAHAAAMAYAAAYLVGQGEGPVRNPSAFVPESSRRSRGMATWAALKELGRDGVVELVDRCCALARHFAAALHGVGGAEVVNDVVLNQVLVRFGDDDRTRRVVEAVQRSGECWMGGTTWHGMALVRVAVSNWSTTEADVDRSVQAILTAAQKA